MNRIRAAALDYDMMKTGNAAQGYGRMMELHAHFLRMHEAIERLFSIGAAYSRLSEYDGNDAIALRRALVSGWAQRAQELDATGRIDGSFIAMAEEIADAAINPQGIARDRLAALASKYTRPPQGA
jgi:hypothetical protein